MYKIKKIKIIQVLFIILAILISAGAVSADNNTTTVNVDSYQQLTDKVNEAKYARTEVYEINLKKDTYLIGENITYSKKSEYNPKLVINGNGSIIDGQHKKTFLLINSLTTVTINNLTIQNTYDEVYSPIFNVGDLTLNNVTFKNNTVVKRTQGGAVLNRANLTADHCTFINNTSPLSAGIYNFGTALRSPELRLNSCTFINNTSDMGCCLLSVESKSVIINNTNMTGNTAENTIISTDHTGDIQIENTDISGNSADKILILGNNATLKNTTISDNNMNTGLKTNLNRINIIKSTLNSNNITQNLIENDKSELIIKNTGFCQNNAKNSLIHSLTGKTIIDSNIFLQNKVPDLFNGTCETFISVNNNTYLKNNLRYTTLRIQNPEQISYYQNITMQIKLQTSPVYNTTIKTGKIQILNNNKTIITQKIKNGACDINTYHNSTCNLNLEVLYTDDEENYQPAAINTGMVIKTPEYNMKLTVNPSYEYKNPVQYSVILANTGESTGYNVTINNIIPRTLELINSTGEIINNSWTVDSIGVNETKNMTIHALSKTPGDIEINPETDDIFCKNIPAPSSIHYRHPDYDIQVLKSDYMIADKLENFLSIKNTGDARGYDAKLIMEIQYENNTNTTLEYSVPEINPGQTHILSDNTTQIMTTGRVNFVIRVVDTTGNTGEIKFSRLIRQPYIKFEKTESNMGETVNITATIENINTTLSGKCAFKFKNKTVRNSPVIFKDNQVTLVNFKIPETLKDVYNSFELIYDQKNLPLLKNSTTLKVIPLKTKAQIEDVILKPGLSVNLTVHLTDQYNRPVTRGRIVIKINRKTLKNSENKVIYLQITNKTAVLNYTVPATFTGKTYLLSMVYDGSNMYTQIRKNTTLKTIIQDTGIKIDENMNGKNCTIKVHLTANTTNRPIHGGNMVIKINGRTITPKIPVKTETVSIEFNSTRINNITVCYSGNAIYNSAKTTKNITPIQQQNSKYEKIKET